MTAHTSSSARGSHQLRVGGAGVGAFGVLNGKLSARAGVTGLEWHSQRVDNGLGAGYGHR